MRKMTLLQALVITTGLAGAAPLALAATSAAPPISKDATLTIGIGIDMDTLDPAQQTTTTVMNVLDYELQTLIGLNKEGKLVPELATSWAVSGDGLAITFHLRKDVEFHDGTPLNAEAVKFSLGRIISGKVTDPIGQMLQAMKSVDVIDPYTVKIVLKHHEPDLLRRLSGPDASIIAPSSVGKDGNTYANIQHPIGTGPYQLVKRVHGSELVFDRVDHYWGPEPYYDKVVFRIEPETSALEAGLRSGQLNIIMNPPVTDIAVLKSQGYNVLEAPDDRSVYIALVTNKPPFNNQDVRQAVNYAVNKAAIIKNVEFGAVGVSDSPFAPTLEGYCKVGAYQYDPAKAKTLLAESGVKDISITMGTPRGRYTEDFQAAQAIASYLRAVGIKVNVRTSDWASYLALALSTHDTYNAYLLGWAPIALGAVQQMTFFVKESWPPDGANGTFYADPKVEALFVKVRAETDAAKRDQMYCQMQKDLWADAPFIYLWHQKLILAYDKDLAGVSYIPNEMFAAIYAHPTTAR